MCCTGMQPVLLNTLEMSPSGNWFHILSVTFLVFTGILFLFNILTKAYTFLYRGCYCSEFLKTARRLTILTDSGSDSVGR